MLLSLQEDVVMITGFCSVHAAAERWKELATYHNVDNGSCDEMSGELEALEIKMYVIFRWE